MSKFLQNKFFKGVAKVWNNKFFSLMCVRLAILAIILNLFVESVSRHSLIKGLGFMVKHPLVFLFNVVMIFFTLTLAGFFKKRIFVATLVSAVWIFFGVTNGVILMSRKTPFTAPDLLNIADGLRTAPLYLSVTEFIIIGVGIFIGIAVIVMIAIKSPSVSKKINYMKSGLIMAVSFGIMMAYLQIGNATGLLATNFGNIAQAYRNYGFGYCFSSSVFRSGISKPKEYSHEKVEDVVSEAESKVPDVIKDNAEDSLKEDERPNIIYVQLESYFDPTLLKDVTYSEDPVPNLHKLYKEFSSGYFSVPIFGAGTVNTEFEAMTGMNLDDFGPGEYPYKTVLRDKTCESICYYLKKYGYTTNALHDNTATFYQRNTVFSRLGFDTFTSLEYIENYEETAKGWAKDACLTDEIIGILDSTDTPDYIYTISVQGHGDYPSDTEGMDLPIKVTQNDVTDNPNGFEYYVNQVHDMDTFVGDLVSRLSKRQEKTIVVFYGDHLPTFEFTDDMMVNGDIFQSEYVIWNNFGMEVINKDIQAYQLSAYLMSRLGMTGGVISDCHMKYLDNPDDENYLSDLKLLEYDILYGDCDSYAGEFPYMATNIKMGYKNISISSVRNIKEHVIVSGENFTPRSFVQVNGEDVDCIFDDSHTLLIDGYQLEEGDRVVVVQKNWSDTVLSSTSIFIYTGQ